MFRQMFLTFTYAFKITWEAALREPPAYFSTQGIDVWVLACAHLQFVQVAL